MGNNIKELTAEVEKLNERLAEAQETLRAIRSGEVDALVAQTRDGDRVYTLQGADYTYRVMFEAMNEGAAVVAPDGAIFYSNSRLAAMLKVPLEKVIGATLTGFITPGCRTAFRSLLTQSAVEPGQIEVGLKQPGGIIVPALVSARSIMPEKTRMVCLIVTDLTLQKRQEEIVASERLARSIIEQAGEYIIVCDTEGRIIRASETTGFLCNCDYLFKRFDSVFNLCEKNGATFSIDAPLRGETVQNLPVTSGEGENREELLANARPLRRGNDEIIGAIVTLSDVTELERARAELETHRNHLEELVRERTNALRNLSHRLLKVQDDERKAIAGELHDEIGQSLTVINLMLSSAIRAPQEDLANVKEARETVKRVLGQVRSLSSSLHPGMLDSIGLLPTLQWYFADFTKRSEIEIKFHHAGLRKEPPSQVKITVYRIIQEAITNVLRYAGVNTVKIDLRQKNGMLNLLIEDKGKGFEPDAVPPERSGLRGMRERANLIGGELTIRSALGAGTCIEARLPVNFGEEK